MDRIVYVFGEGRIHIALRRGHELLTDERCNIDAIEDRVWVDDLGLIEAGHERCKRCFPPAEPFSVTTTADATTATTGWVPGASEPVTS